MLRSQPAPGSINYELNPSLRGKSALEAGMFLTCGYGDLSVRVLTDPAVRIVVYELPALGVLTRPPAILGDFKGASSYLPSKGPGGPGIRTVPPESGFRRTDIRIRTNSRAAGPLLR